LKKLEHPNIVKFLEFGTNGYVVKANKTINKLVYMTFEYVPMTLFDMVNGIGKMGEEAGRVFMS